MQQHTTIQACCIVRLIALPVSLGLTSCSVSAEQAEFEIAAQVSQV